MMRTIKTYSKRAPFYNALIEELWYCRFVAWMLRCHLQLILRRPEFNRDVLLRLHRPLIQQRWSVAPLPNGCLCGRKKSVRTAQELYLPHLAKLPDRGANPDRFCQSTVIPRPSIAWPHKRDK